MVLSRNDHTGNIGIFWVLKRNKLLVHSIPWDKAEDMIGNWCNYGGHYEYWEQYSKKHCISCDYVRYPRGRVIYNKRTGRFKILSSKEVIKNKKLAKRIAHAFNLRKYITVADTHYEKAHEIDEHYEDTI